MCYIDCKGVEVREGDHYICRHAHGAICRRHIEDAMCILMRNEPAISSVYLLFHEGQVVYIGTTGHFWSRIRDHVQQGKDWDSVLWSELPDAQQARAYERSLLENCQELPRYNRSRVH